MSSMEKFNLSYHSFVSFWFLCNIIMALPQREANIVWNCVNIFILITSIEDDVKHEILNAWY